MMMPLLILRANVSLHVCDGYLRSGRCHGGGVAPEVAGIIPRQPVESPVESPIVESPIGVGLGLRREGYGQRSEKNGRSG